MFKRWAAYGFVLALCALAPNFAGGQSAQPKKAAGGFQQNYPNPFNPETTIPFSVGDVPCSDASRQHVVSIRITNVLTQPVAVPRLQGTKDGMNSGQAGQLTTNLRLKCGSFEAYWDGKDQRTKRSVASGLYTACLIVDGVRAACIEMLVTK
jgi:hypothetical protein